MGRATVRDARREDCEAIAAIYNEWIAEGRSTFEAEPRSVAEIEAWLGFARQPVLVAAALRDRAERAAFSKLLGKCFSENAAAIQLVARYGFRTVGVYLRHGQIGGQWHDVVVVELLLGRAAE